MQESQCVIQKTKHSFVGNCFFQAKCHSPGDLRRANCRRLHKHGVMAFTCLAGRRRSVAAAIIQYLANPRCAACFLAHEQIILAFLQIVVP